MDAITEKLIIAVFLVVLGVGVSILVVFKPRPPAQKSNKEEKDASSRPVESNTKVPPPRMAGDTTTDAPLPKKKSTKK